jgi:hypothetical protein
VVLAWLRRCGTPEEVVAERIDAILDASERRCGGRRIEIGGGWSVVVGRDALTVRDGSAHNDEIGETIGRGGEEAT